MLYLLIKRITHSTYLSYHHTFLIISKQLNNPFIVHISQSNCKSVTTLGGFQHNMLGIQHSPQCQVISGSYHNTQLQPWEQVGILHKLAITNKGGYSRASPIFNGQSESPWKYQYYNPYWLSSEHNKGITPKLYISNNFAFT